MCLSFIISVLYLQRRPFSLLLHVDNLLQVPLTQAIGVVDEDWFDANNDYIDSPQIYPYKCCHQYSKCFLPK